MRKSNRARGFTVIELAVVIVVIALILGSVLVPLNSQVQQRNVTETQRILEETRQAVIGFAMITGRLPRPAVDINGVEPLGGCATEAACTGFIPWATLGTPRADAWGKVLRYSVNSNYAGKAIGTDAISASQFTVTTGQRIVKSRNVGGGEFDLATNVPAVILSHGARNLGMSIDGFAFPDSPDTNTDEDANAAAGAITFYSRTAADNAAAGGGEFDDQAVWVTPTQLFSQLVAAGRLP